MLWSWERRSVGQATLFVVLCVALSWRWRDRPLRASGALTAAVCIKLLVWPVVVWFLLTRRYRVGIYSALASSVLIAGSWAVIGFDGFVGYPNLLQSTADVLGEKGLLLYALLIKYVSHSVATIGTLLAAWLFMTGAWVCRDDDRLSLTLTLLAALFATPIFWLHYFGLLIVPIALYGGLLWSVVPVLWVIALAPVGPPRPVWMIVLFIAVTCAVAVRAVASALPLRPA